MRVGPMMTTAIAAAVAGALIAACGGGSGSSSSSSPTSPTTTTGTTTGGTTSTSTTTITITSSGVSPKSITVPVGSQVTFVNNDTVTHDMASNPHPEHTDCPALNQIGFLSPGQSRSSGNLTTVRTCGFHDHNQPSNAGLIGSIVIQ